MALGGDGGAVAWPAAFLLVVGVEGLGRLTGSLLAVVLVAAVATATAFVAGFFAAGIAALPAIVLRAAGLGASFGLAAVFFTITASFDN